MINVANSHSQPSLMPSHPLLTIWEVSPSILMEVVWACNDPVATIFLNDLTTLSMKTMQLLWGMKKLLNVTVRLRKSNLSRCLQLLPYLSATSSTCFWFILGLFNSFGSLVCASRFKSHISAAPISILGMSYASTSILTPDTARGFRHINTLIHSVPIVPNRIIVLIGYCHLLAQFTMPR